MKLNEIVERLVQIRDTIAELNNAVEELNSERDGLELTLLEKMEELGTIQVATGTYTASKTTRLLPQAEDWGAIEKYVKDNDAFYLYQRRLSPVAYRELLEMGEEVPGIVPYERDGISVRKVRD